MGRYHDGPCDYHPPYLVSSVAPTSAGLGYPLRIGDIWLDVSGGIGVQRRCTVLHDDGTGTWVLDGPAVVKLPLGDTDTAGGVLAWRNPEGAAIVVKEILVNFTALPVDGTHTVDIGYAANGTTADDTVRADYGTNVAGVRVATQTDSPALVAAGDWLTISTASGAAAGLAGYAYVYYHLA